MTTPNSNISNNNNNYGRRRRRRQRREEERINALIDLISKVKVIRDYDPQDESELQLRVGEIITLLGYNIGSADSNNNNNNELVHRSNSGGMGIVVPPLLLPDGSNNSPPSNKKPSKGLLKKSSKKNANTSPSHSPTITGFSTQSANVVWHYGRKCFKEGEPIHSFALMEGYFPAECVEVYCPEQPAILPAVESKEKDKKQKKKKNKKNPIRVREASEEKIEELFHQFKRIVALHDFQQDATNIYKNCFIGKEAIDAMVAHLDCIADREQALELGIRFYERGFLKHIHEMEDFKDAYLHYHFVDNFLDSVVASASVPLLAPTPRTPRTPRNNESQNSRAFCDRGWERLKSPNPNLWLEALEQFDEAIVLDPQNAYAYHGRAVAKFRIQQPSATAIASPSKSSTSIGPASSCLDDFTKSLKILTSTNAYYTESAPSTSAAAPKYLPPAVLRVHVDRAWCYAVLIKDYKEAESDFNFVIDRAGPENEIKSETYYQRAMYYKYRKLYDKAVSDLSKAIDYLYIAAPPDDEMPSNTNVGARHHNNNNNNAAASSPTTTPTKSGNHSHHHHHHHHNNNDNSDNDDDADEEPTPIVFVTTHVTSGNNVKLSLPLINAQQQQHEINLKVQYHYERGECYFRNGKIREAWKDLVICKWNSNKFNGDVKLLTQCEQLHEKLEKKQRKPRKSIFSNILKKARSPSQKATERPDIAALADDR